MSSLIHPSAKLERGHSLERQAGARPVDLRSWVDMAVATARLRGRSFMRALESLPLPRRGFGHAFAVAFVAAGWMYGAFVGGFGSVVISETAAVFGLKSTDIIITGQIETTEQDVFQSLNVGGSLLGFNTAQARERVLQLPWIKAVAVRKLYPGKLSVAVVEKQAMAVWQHNDRLTVVEKTGVPITRFGISELLNNKFTHLPHLVGEGAAEAADEILPIAAEYPEIAERALSYVRIANRRWDIELANGLRIQLPENDIALALSQLDELAGEASILEREISVIDMRLPDRIALRLESDAAKTRHELVSARLKAMKKADRKL